MVSLVSSHRFECRFAAGPEGRIASGIWLLWSGKNTPDLYLACKRVSQSLKVSIHFPRPGKPSIWRSWGFTREATGAIVDAAIAEGGRHKLTWDGAPLASGYTAEWRVMIPGAALAPEPSDAPSNVTVLEGPAEDRVLVVAIGLGPVGGSIVPRCSDAVSHPLAQGWLSNRMSVWCTYTYVPLSTVHIPPGSGTLTGHGDRDELRRLAAAGHLRAIGVASNSDGSLVFVDGRVQTG